MLHTQVVTFIFLVDKSPLSQGKGLPFSPRIDSREIFVLQNGGALEKIRIEILDFE